MADAAFTIFKKDCQSCTGNYFVDEDLLISNGQTDMSKYANVSDSDLAPDLFL